MNGAVGFAFEAFPRVHNVVFDVAEPASVVAWLEAALAAFAVVLVADAVPEEHGGYSE